MTICDHFLFRTALDDRGGIYNVAGDGTLDADRVLAAIREDTALVAVMWANNETGVLHPVEGIAAVRVDINIQGRETRPFRQEIAPADAMPHAGIAPLEEGHGGGDGGLIPGELGREGLGPGRALGRGEGGDAVAHRRQARPWAGSPMPCRRSNQPAVNGPFSER